MGRAIYATLLAQQFQPAIAPPDEEGDVEEPNPAVSMKRLHCILLLQDLNGACILVGASRPTRLFTHYQAGNAETDMPTAAVVDRTALQMVRESKGRVVMDRERNCIQLDSTNRKKWPKPAQVGNASFLDFVFRAGALSAFPDAQLRILAQAAMRNPNSHRMPSYDRRKAKGEAA